MYVGVSRKRRTNVLETIAGLPDNVLGIKASGEVTAEDYKKVLVPAVETTLKAEGKLRLLYVFDADVSGMSAGAAWQDGKVGLGHYNRWEKVAVVTNRDWLRHSLDIFGHLMPGELKAFTTDEEAEARTWVSS
jgi:SpoIIAA-like